jgi:probable rRNA maturation factor
MTLLIKASPAIAVIGVVDLTRAASRIGATTYEPLPPFAIATVLYMLLVLAFVSAQRIAELNAEHRGKPGPTDVLSFPIDGEDPSPGPRELGDIVICPEHTADLREAIVHGALHLTGMDHEVDDGEMLAVQREILAWVTPDDGP